MSRRLPGRKLVTRWYRWGRGRVLGGVVVLGYHRLSADPVDPFDLAVPPETFAAHLEFITRRARPISLRDAVRALRSAGRLPPRAVAVTFDDGYADTVGHALPLLERSGVPATVFVTTGFMGREYWWDELARTVLGPHPSPGPLELEIGGRRRVWRMAGAERGPATPAHRREVLLSIAAELRSLEAAELDIVLQRLREWRGQDPRSTPRHRGLTPDEVRRLAASPLIEIGAHTVSHPVLPRLSPGEQQREIEGSRAELVRITGRAVTSFSYPNGAYSHATLTAVKETGFEIACSSVPDVATRRSDPLALPRLWADRRPAQDFARWLDRWLTG